MRFRGQGASSLSDAFFGPSWQATGMTCMKPLDMLAFKLLCRLYRERRSVPT